MRKEDLLNGDILQSNNNDYYIYLENDDKKRNLLNINGGFMELDDYDENFIFNNPDYRFSIKKIFRFSCNVYLIDFIKNKKSISYANLIWERKSIKEMTVSEIEKALGITGLRIKKED